MSVSQTAVYESDGHPVQQIAFLVPVDLVPGGIYFRFGFDKVQDGDMRQDGFLLFRRS
jgi:hypothetical protein